jgi:hypothetical protein
MKKLLLLLTGSLFAVPQTWCGDWEIGAAALYWLPSSCGFEVSSATERHFRMSIL